MNSETVRAAVLRVLHGIAPEADLDALAGTADLRETLDLDSMDFLRFVQGLQRELGVEVPEEAYARVGTLDACVQWLVARDRSLSAPGGSSR